MSQEMSPQERALLDAALAAGRVTVCPTVYLAPVQGAAPLGAALPAAAPETAWKMTEKHRKSVILANQRRSRRGSENSAQATRNRLGDRNAAWVKAYRETPTRETIAALAAGAGLSVQRVRDVLSLAGLALPADNRGMSAAEKAEIRRLYAETPRFTFVAERTGRSASAIADYLRRVGDVA